MTSQPSGHGNRSYTTIATAIIIAAVVISAAIVISSPFRTRKVNTTTVATTSPNTSIEAGLFAACSRATSRGIGQKLVVRTNGATVLCVQVYYYNYTAPYVLKPALGITAFEYPPGKQPIEFDAGSNFTVITSPKELIIGGPNSENEGATIAYALTAKPRASGSYELEFPYTYLGQMDCGTYGEIVAGNGEPNYLNQENVGCTETVVSCGMTVVSCTLTNSTEYAVIHDQIFLYGEIYFQISGIANSTRIASNG